MRRSWTKKSVDIPPGFDPEGMRQQALAAIRRGDDVELATLPKEVVISVAAGIMATHDSAEDHPVGGSRFTRQENAADFTMVNSVVPPEVLEQAEALHQEWEAQAAGY
ncbi:MAG: hypothetical protein R3313_04150 [Candidatus Saccharimonadales bacterium]|nr:hypothetical protein [Candidatus Saccharimonadales bacterium]